MPKTRLPSKILDLRGTFKKNPQRRRSNEPVPDTPFPKTPPKHLNVAQRAAWRTIARATPTGLLTGSDVILVEVLACLLAEFRADPHFQASRLARLSMELGRLGLNPSDRVRLAVTPAPAGPGFDDV